MIHFSLGPTHINSWVLYASCQNIGRHLVHLFLDFAKCGKMFAKHTVCEEQKNDLTSTSHLLTTNAVCATNFHEDDLFKIIAGKASVSFLHLVSMSTLRPYQKHVCPPSPILTHFILITIDIQKQWQLHLNDYGRQYQNKSVLQDDRLVDSACNLICL